MCIRDSCYQAYGPCHIRAVYLRKTFASFIEPSAITSRYLSFGYNNTCKLTLATPYIFIFSFYGNFVFVFVMYWFWIFWNTYLCMNIILYLFTPDFVISKIYFVLQRKSASNFVSVSHAKSAAEVKSVSSAVGKSKINFVSGAFSDQILKSISSK